MDRRDVVITGFRLNANEQPTKVLQRVLGMEESQARELSKRFPCIVRADEAWTEAERLMLALRDAGAYAHLREPSARSELPARAASSVPPAELAPLPKEEWGTPPTLFSSPVTEEPARVSRYSLGELEIVAPKSQPAPAIKSQPAPAIKSQPAPAIKSQPAPAIKSQPAPAIKSQPAPAIKSQPAPAQDIGMEAGGLRMLGDSFQDEMDGGHSFELDERALGHQTNRVQTQPRGNALIAAPPRKRRGLFATLLLPLVFAQASIPHALALTGVAAASGAAVYLARTAQLGSGQNKGKQLDDADLAADPGSEKIERKQATHPLVRMAPKAMEGSIASILRARIRGVHKVSIKWAEGTRPEGNVECMLLEQAEAANLKELASTGSVVEVPPAVRDQLRDHILVLRTANADPDAGYLPICLAN